MINSFVKKDDINGFSNPTLSSCHYFFPIRNMVLGSKPTLPIFPMMIENDFIKPFIVHFKTKFSEHVSPIRPYQQLKRKFKSIQFTINSSSHSYHH